MIDRVLYISVQVQLDDTDINIDVIPQSNIEIPISVSHDSIEIPIEVEMGGGTRLPNYDGTYVVTPRKVEQELETKNKSATSNVKVLSIPYEQVGNLGGGYTATIGLE